VTIDFTDILLLALGFPIWAYFVARFVGIAWFRSKREQLLKGGRE